MSILRRLGKWLHHVAPPGNGRTIVMDGPVPDNKAPSFQHRTKVLADDGFLRIHPDDNHAFRSQELHQPIEHRLDVFERTTPPINQSDVILPGCLAAIC